MYFLVTAPNASIKAAETDTLVPIESYYEAFVQIIGAAAYTKSASQCPNPTVTHTIAAF